MSKKFCPQCGELLQEQSGFCALCGFQFNAAPQREEMNTQTKVGSYTQPVFTGAKVPSNEPQTQNQTQYQTQYQAPRVTIQQPEVQQPQKVNYAENGDRFWAFVIDMIIINAFTGLIFHDEGFMWISSGLTVFYFAVFEMMGNGGGQTLGKRALKIKTVDESTLGALNFSQAFIHSLGKVLFGLVDLIVGSILNDRDKDNGAPDKRQIRLTQRLAKTAVIKLEQ